jgi:hypothetical protein
MSNGDQGFDYHRYRKLLAEADDEPKRLALIGILVDERARDRLASERSHELVRKMIAPRGASGGGRQ